MNMTEWTVYSLFYCQVSQLQTITLTEICVLIYQQELNVLNSEILHVICIFSVCLHDLRDKLQILLGFDNELY